MTLDPDTPPSDPRRNSLQELGKRMDARFEEIASDFTVLRREFMEFQEFTIRQFKKIDRTIAGMRNDSRELFEYVVFLDEDFQKHRGDPAAHRTTP